MSSMLMFCDGEVGRDARDDALLIATDHRYDAAVLHARARF